ncbi:4'-phosphopantetheinyl transferase superfamily protein [Shinella zoogloeoides]|uniref:4'-phosphopantetheinyl transferase superfamily protein n=1 Tax=Shinella zoogloeoides TaxID=352475 RepID=UPI0028A766F6|nr:4'-phosphopantetheinyl transferase superfamily protein [Shinella zoogloeoides]
MSDSAAETALLAQMNRLALPAVRLGCRLIRDGDEALLLPEEAAALPARRLAARRASGAARALARDLLTAEGMISVAIGRGPAGDPLWPAGFAGSLAHDDEMAVAVIARKADIPSLGIDVEPAEPLPDEIAALAVMSGDVLEGVDPRLATRLLFSAKEAVYKAAYPLDEEILGYEHIGVDLARREAMTARGRRMRLSFCLLPRILVLAVAEDQPASR